MKIHLYRSWVIVFAMHWACPRQDFQCSPWSSWKSLLKMFSNKNWLAVGNEWIKSVKCCLLTYIHHISCDNYTVYSTVFVVPKHTPRRKRSGHLIHLHVKYKTILWFHVNNRAQCLNRSKVFHPSGLPHKWNKLRVTVVLPREFGSFGYHLDENTGSFAIVRLSLVHH